jgi:hypothetical protein
MEQLSDMKKFYEFQLQDGGKLCVPSEQLTGVIAAQGKQIAVIVGRTSYLVNHSYDEIMTIINSEKMLKMS